MVFCRILQKNVEILGYRRNCCPQNLQKDNTEFSRPWEFICVPVWYGTIPTWSGTRLILLVPQGMLTGHKTLPKQTASISVLQLVITILTRLLIVHTQGKNQNSWFMHGPFRKQAPDRPKRHLQIVVWILRIITNLHKYIISPYLRYFSTFLRENNFQDRFQWHLTYTSGVVTGQK